MRKLLLVLVSIVALSAAVVLGSLILGNKGGGPEEKAAEFSPDERFKLAFEFPLGLLLEYDVNIERHTTASTTKGKVSFGVEVEMEQALVNHKDLDDRYKQFHMDRFEDISVLEARLNDGPLDQETRKRQLEAATRDFKFGAYIFNEFEMKKNGLPAKPPEIKKEGDLIQGQLSYIQFFPGEKRKVGEKWRRERKLGDYKAEYDFTFENVVYYNDYKCAKIKGVSRISPPPEKIEFFPTEFTLWLSIDEKRPGVVVASEIHEKWRSHSGDVWFVRELSLRKTLRSAVLLDPDTVGAVDKHAQELVDIERKLRKSNRDRSKDFELLDKLRAVKAAFGDKLPFTRGIDFILEMND